MLFIKQAFRFHPLLFIVPFIHGANSLLLQNTQFFPISLSVLGTEVSSGDIFTHLQICFYSHLHCAVLFFYLLFHCTLPSQMFTPASPQDPALQFSYSVLPCPDEI